MKALLINGSPNKEGCTYTALKELSNTLNKNDVETEILYLGKKPIAGCVACWACRKTGKCVFDDKVNELSVALDDYNAIVFGSPVYYGNASGQIRSFLDRLFFSSTAKMAGKLGASVVSCRRGGAATAFDQLNKYFGLAHMPIVSSQYWNQVHGSTPEEVLKDEEGMQTMRALAQNMAWLLKSIEAGKNAGIEFPVYEPRIWTNFAK